MSVVAGEASVPRERESILRREHMLCSFTASRPAGGTSGRRRHAHRREEMWAKTPSVARRRGIRGGARLDPPPPTASGSPPRASPWPSSSYLRLSACSRRNSLRRQLGHEVGCRDPSRPPRRRLPLVLCNSPTRRCPVAVELVLASRRRLTALPIYSPAYLKPAACLDLSRTPSAPSCRRILLCSEL